MIIHRIHRRMLVPLLACLMGLHTVAAADLSGTRIYALPGTSVFPEGIALDEHEQAYYVSSAHDGTIYRGKVGFDATVFLPGGLDGRTIAGGMKVDDDGHLFVASGPTGQVYIYDVHTRQLLAHFAGAPGGLVNDVVVTRRGIAFFTDSLAPVLYRVWLDQQGSFQFETYLDFTGTALAPGPMGFILNGIAATKDGRYLIAVQSFPGTLYRIDTLTREVRAIDLGGAVIAGDGLVLDGQMLYAVVPPSREIVAIRLADDYTTGTIVTRFGDASFAFPTAIARYDKRLLVVNSQFDAKGGFWAGPDAADPSLPFTITDLPIPATAQP